MVKRKYPFISEKICPTCGKNLIFKNYTFDRPWRKFCSIGCHTIWKNKNIPQSEETRRKASERCRKTFNGIKRTKEFSEKIRQENIRRIKNGTHNFYKGGITPLMRLIRNHYKVIGWQQNIFKRDDFTCLNCGKRGGYLEAHHIKSFSDIMSENKIDTLEKSINCYELWDTNNGVSLCRKCHDKTKKVGE